MAQVRVRWLQRVNGRYPGLEEVVERTPYIDALAAQNRLEIVFTLAELKPLAVEEVPVAEPPACPPPIVGVFNGDLEVTPETDEAVVEEPVRPKPRAPRKPRPALDPDGDYTDF